MDADLVRRLIAAQFPQWRQLPVEPVVPGGHDHRTFRLGDELLARLPSGEGYALQVAKEQRWLPELAPLLPLEIPAPVAHGMPGEGYPYEWSVYRWIEGEPAGRASAETSGRASGDPAGRASGDPVALAVDLAAFLRALAEVPADGGPAPGPHNFHRGGPVAHYGDEALAALRELGPRVPQERCLAIWERAVASAWGGPPVWFHGDVAEGNLLLRDGRLAAVIDFGTSGVGDPACDVVIAWTLLRGPARTAFRKALGADEGTWARGAGWALWKALITYDDPASRATLAELLEDAG